VESKNVIHAFYDALSRRDGNAMADLYADDVEFHDPVFPVLRSKAAQSMWRMLCKRSLDLTIDYKIIASDGDHHRVRWVAHYTFSGTGRKVCNIVDAKLTVQNGKITRHKDDFNLWKWASQALGPAGFLLGWSPSLRKKIQKQARENLENFMAQA
jgi:ketosteroid isomerase-like protein